MRPLLIAFVLGAVAVGALLGGAAVALGIVATARDWGSFRAELGPIAFVSFERTAGETAFTVGPGVALAAAAGGLLNALGAAALRRRDFLH